MATDGVYAMAGGLSAVMFTVWNIGTWCYNWSPSKDP